MILTFTVALVGCSAGVISSVGNEGSTGIPGSDGGVSSVIAGLDGGSRLPDAGSIRTEPTGPIFYVSLTGNDANDGSEAKPVKTFARASRIATPGSTVYIRAGIYHSTQTINVSGTPDARITFENYPGESVRVDGNGLGIAMNKSLLLVTGSAYVTVRGLEVINSDGRGFEVSASHQVRVEGCTIHHVQWQGLVGSGDDLTFDGNEIYDAQLQNQFGVNASGMWSAAAGSWLKADGTWVKNFVFTNNFVHDSWGECVIALFADTTVLRGNTIRDCWSTNLYLDHVRNAVVEKNFISAGSTTYNKPSVGAPATGLGLAVEPYTETGAVPLENIVIRNNLIMNTGLGINFWGQNGNYSALNTYKNVHIENNVVYGTARRAISFDAVVSGAAVPTGCTIRNNILQAGSVDNIALTLGDTSGWSVQSNDFPAGVPSLVTGNGNFAAAPKFISPTMGSGPTGFGLQSGSSCVAMGVSTELVTDDYWATTRSAKPSVGIYEPR